MGGDTEFKKIQMIKTTISNYLRMEIMKFTAEHLDPLDQMYIFLKIEAEDF